MTVESSQTGESVGDVLSKIGKAVSDGAAGEGLPELLLTEDMRVWGAVPMAAPKAPLPATHTPALDEARIRDIVADSVAETVQKSVLEAVSTNPEIGALIRRAARPEPEVMERIVRASVGPLVEEALSERLGELKKAVTETVDRHVAEAKSGFAALEEGRKKQARKAVRAELKSLLSTLNDD